MRVQWLELWAAYMTNALTLLSTIVENTCRANSTSASVGVGLLKGKPCATAGVDPHMAMFPGTSGANQATRTSSMPVPVHFASRGYSIMLALL